MVGSDHTVNNLVIVLYLGISDKDTLFKTDTGTNINALPQYSYLYTGILSYIAI
ncbi:unnamed protein product [marine sediment metagenome]|uniref:Uncharacterized protein n=1 Tax=marine sediment metagenome TaxID=412755 RepID=X1H547_9ZZZZ